MAKKIIEKSEPVRMCRAFTGIVTSTAMNKTITAKVEEMKLNEKYQKKFKVSKKFHIHDEKGEATVGDVVNFVECRPLSKTKRWRLVEVKSLKSKV